MIGTASKSWVLIYIFFYKEQDAKKKEREGEEGWGGGGGGGSRKRRPNNGQSKREKNADRMSEIPTPKNTHIHAKSTNREITTGEKKERKKKN